MPKNADGTPLISPITEIPSTSYFELVDSSNCVITAFKRSERDTEKFILRIAEMRGEQTMAMIQFNQNLFYFKNCKLVNGLENEIESADNQILFDN